MRSDEITSTTISALKSITARTTARRGPKTIRQVIARSRPVGKGNNRIYVRHYPQGGLFGNPIGYSFVDRGRVGFELSLACDFRIAADDVQLALSEVMIGMIMMARMMPAVRNERPRPKCSE
jgi:hypothetical protein